VAADRPDQRFAGAFPYLAAFARVLGACHLPLRIHGDAARRALAHLLQSAPCLPGYQPAGPFARKVQIDLLAIHQKNLAA